MDSCLAKDKVKTQLTASAGYRTLGLVEWEADELLIRLQGVYVLVSTALFRLAV